MLSLCSVNENIVVYHGSLLVEVDASSDQVSSKKEVKNTGIEVLLIFLSKGNFQVTIIFRKLSFVFLETRVLANLSENFSQRVLVVEENNDARTFYRLDSQLTSFATLLNHCFTLFKKHLSHALNLWSWSWRQLYPMNPLSFRNIDFPLFTYYTWIYFTSLISLTCSFRVRTLGKKSAHSTCSENLVWARRLSWIGGFFFSKMWTACSSSFRNIFSSTTEKNSVILEEYDSAKELSRVLA